MAFYDKIWKTKLSDCKSSEECKHINPDENMNCVNNCTSVICYNRIYAAEPLEDGEIDAERNRKFISCLRDECKRNGRKLP